MEKPDTLSFEVTAEDLEKFKRLDQFLQEKIPAMSRSLIKKSFEQEMISSESQKLQLKKMPPIGTIIEIEIPEPIPLDAQAEDIPLTILYEDGDILVLDKPAGLVVHPAPGNYTGTLVNALLHHIKDLKGIGNVQRPGIVHRLDKGTSGVMVVAKSQKAHEKLVLMFSEHDLERRYIALTLPSPNASAGHITTMMHRHPQSRLKMTSSYGDKGKQAKTLYKVLKTHELLSLIEFTLQTGRTHQIRVHTTEVLKSPILGDTVYGNPKQQLTRVPEEIRNILGDYPHPLLHAKSLAFNHPITGEKLAFETAPPKPFIDCLQVLGWK